MVESEGWDKKSQIAVASTAGLTLRVSIVFIIIIIIIISESDVRLHFLSSPAVGSAWI